MELNLNPEWLQQKAAAEAASESVAVGISTPVESDTNKRPEWWTWLHEWWASGGRNDIAYALELAMMDPDITPEALQFEIATVVFLSMLEDLAEITKEIPSLAPIIIKRYMMKDLPQQEIDHLMEMMRNQNYAEQESPRPAAQETSVGSIAPETPSAQVDNGFEHQFTSQELLDKRFDGEPESGYPRDSE